MTYPDPAVREAVASRFVALRLHLKEPHVRTLNILWMPTVLVLDRRGVEHARNVNSVPPAEFLDFLDLGEAHARMKEGQYETAERLLAAALARRDRGPLTDELLYFHAIAAYFTGHHDHAARDRIWRDLAERFPDSIWTKRIP